MNRSNVLWEGLVAGLLGYVTVVLVVGLLDALAGFSFFHTPSVLGRALFGGFGDPAGGVAAGPVFAYNGVHLLVFLFIGMLASWIVWEVELHPVFWYVAFFAVMTLVLVTFLVLALVTEPLSGRLSRGTIVTGNAIAAVVVGTYLAMAHPRLRERIERGADPEYEEE